MYNNFETVNDRKFSMFIGYRDTVTVPLFRLLR